MVVRQSIHLCNENALLASGSCTVFYETVAVQCGPYLCYGQYLFHVNSDALIRVLYVSYRVSVQVVLE